MKFVVAAVALLVSVGASWADDQPISKAAPPLPSTMAYNWTGFYLGGAAGLQAVSSAWKGNCFSTLVGPGFETACEPAHMRPPSSSERLDNTGAQLGGFVGYNWQFAPWGLLGVEGDAAWGDAKASLAGGYPGLLARFTSVNDSGSISTGWSASLRSRAGFFPMSGLLLYTTGGVAFQQFSFSASCPGSDLGNWCLGPHSEAGSTVRTGYTLGAGVEKAFGGRAGLLDNGPWHVRLEYRYANFGRLNHTFFANTFDEIGVSFPLHTQTVQAGVSYSF